MVETADARQSDDLRTLSRSLQMGADRRGNDACVRAENGLLLSPQFPTRLYPVSVQDVQTLVRTMKALSAASFVQYERSVAALADYVKTVELGLQVALRESDPKPARFRRAAPSR